MKKRKPTQTPTPLSPLRTQFLFKKITSDDQSRPVSSSANITNKSDSVDSVGETGSNIPFWLDSWQMDLNSSAFLPFGIFSLLCITLMGSEIGSFHIKRFKHSSLVLLANVITNLNNYWMCFFSLKTATEPQWFNIQIKNGLTAIVTGSNQSFSNSTIPIDQLSWEGQVTFYVNDGGFYCYTSILDLGLVCRSICENKTHITLSVGMINHTIREWG